MKAPATAAGLVWEQLDTVTHTLLSVSSPLLTRDHRVWSSVVRVAGPGHASSSPAAAAGITEFSLQTAYGATTHKIMLPKNYRKILVVFSFFEIFCTRVGNSERFSQGKFCIQGLWIEFLWTDFLHFSQPRDMSPNQQQFPTTRKSGKLKRRFILFQNNHSLNTNLRCQSIKVCLIPWNLVLLHNFVGWQKLNQVDYTNCTSH